MNSTRSWIDDYYFVPLGREPGSYLDFLGLPPTASEIEVAAKDRAYRRQLGCDFRTSRSELIKKRDHNEITEEEYNSGVKKLEEERTEKRIEINKLREKYNLEPAEKRRILNMGLKDDSAVWVDMYESFLYASEADCLGKLIFKQHPFPQMEPSQLVGIPLPGHNRNSQMNEDIYFDEITISCLLKADELWSRLKCTNLEFWLKEIEKWDKELDSITPRLKIIPGKNKNCIDDPDFPTLCHPFNLAIEQINDEEVENLFNMPERKGELNPISANEFLAAFEHISMDLMNN